MTSNTDPAKVSKQTPTKKSDTALLDYLECELKESKSLDEFKAKFAEIKIIRELSRQASSGVAVTEKINWGEYYSIVVRETAEKATEIMNQIEALNDFWYEMMGRFVTREGSEECGRPLLNEEKQALVKLLTKGKIETVKEKTNP